MVLLAFLRPRRIRNAVSPTTQTRTKQFELEWRETCYGYRGGLSEGNCAARDVCLLDDWYGLMMLWSYRRTSKNTRNETRSNRDVKCTCLPHGSVCKSMYSRSSRLSSMKNSGLETINGHRVRFFSPVICFRRSSGKSMIATRHGSRKCDEYQPWSRAGVPGLTMIFLVRQSTRKDNCGTTALHDTAMCIVSSTCLAGADGHVTVSTSTYPRSPHTSMNDKAI